MCNIKYNYYNILYKLHLVKKYNYRDHMVDGSSLRHHLPLTPQFMEKYVKGQVRVSSQTHRDIHKEYFYFKDKNKPAYTIMDKELTSTVFTATLKDLSFRIVESEPYRSLRETSKVHFMVENPNYDPNVPIISRDYVPQYSQYVLDGDKFTSLKATYTLPEVDLTCRGIDESELVSDVVNRLRHQLVKEVRKLKVPDFLVRER